MPNRASDEDFDRPFGGNGSRWQNWAGQRPHWWNISYDTDDPVQRGVQVVMGLIYAILSVVAVILILLAVLKAY